MTSQHKFSLLKDKFYNFCFKDSVVLKKVSRKRLRLYVIIGLLCLIGVSVSSFLWKKQVPTSQEMPKPAMMIEPVAAPSVPVAVVIEPVPVPAPVLEKKEDPVVEPVKEPVVAEEHLLVEKEETLPEAHIAPADKEKPKSTIERVSKGNNELDTLYQKAISFVKQKKFFQARSILQRDDIIRHSHGKALTMLVKIFLNERSYDMIETYARKYLDLYPSEKGEVLLAYGYALSALQKHQDLIKAFGVYVPSPEKQRDYHKLLGQAHLKQKNYAPAREIYEQLLQNDGNNPKLLMALLISQIGLKDMDAAQITMGKLYQQPLDARESQALKKMGKLVVVGE